MNEPVASDQAASCDEVPIGQKGARGRYLRMIRNYASAPRPECGGERVAYMIGNGDGVRAISVLVHDRMRSDRRDQLFLTTVVVRRRR